MLNNVLKKILYSFGLTILVSVLGGLFCMNFGFNFWITSSFLFLLQVVGFYFYGEYVKRNNAHIEAQLELEAIAELRRITADVVCPCDKKVQTTIPLDMSTDNSYICAQCSKKVGVIVDIKTVLKTEPMQEDPLKNPQILKNVEEVLKDPRHNDRI
jgi:DNA-directed RNA polymerase subunit RPC12/RpoP